MKTCTEQYLKDSGLNYTIFRLCGFMQVMPWLAVFACCLRTTCCMCVRLTSCFSKIVLQTAQIHQVLSADGAWIVHNREISVLVSKVQ